MSQIPVNVALKSLTRWWTDMGVAPDAAEMRAYETLISSAGLATAAPDTPHGAERGPAAPQPVQKTRRPGKKTPEDWAEEAAMLAARCNSLDALTNAIAAFEGCPLKDGADKTVVYDGAPGAPVMVIGEGPGRDEDREGRPFVGRAGQLLDRMLGSIGLSRSTNVLITNVNYWRPPRNRNPEPDELLVCAPFVRRMIALNHPKLIIAAGAVPAKALLGTPSGIMKLRGTQQTLKLDGLGPVPLVPIFHPAYLLRRPEEKARAWRDLLEIEQRLSTLT